MGRKSNFLLFLALIASGCAAKGTVSGQVKFKGGPLPFGRISFISQKNNQVYSGTIMNGAYSVASIPAGPATVTVQTFASSPTDVKSAKQKVSLPDLPLPPGADEKPQATPTLPKYIQIPKRYADPNESKLTYTVQKGDHTHNIDLEP